LASNDSVTGPRGDTETIQAVGPHYEKGTRAAPLHAELAVVRAYSNFLKSSTVNPASRAIPPIVIAFTGLWRGIVNKRDDMLALSYDLESSFLQGSHSFQMIHSWNFRHG